MDQKAPTRIHNSPIPTLGESGNGTIRVLVKYEYKSSFCRKKALLLYFEGNFKKDSVWRV